MKVKFLTISSMLAFLLLVSESAHAVFQNWQSDAFEEKQPGKKVAQPRDTEARQLEKEIQEDPAIDEEAYYEATAPKDMERDHNYLDEDHSLQEDQIPNEGVK